MFLSTSPNVARITASLKSPGKTATQDILNRLYAYQPVDDGATIRRFATDHLGLSQDDVYTQAGKAGHVEILGKRWQVRDILDTYGKQLEAMFGADIMPFLGTRGLEPGTRYSFGSVRRSQAAFYKSMGGLVIGIRNPLVGPSRFDFDQFDESLVDHWVENDQPGLDALGLKVVALMNRIETGGRRALAA